MFGLTAVTGFPLIAGLLQGINQRNKTEFKADPWASYKIMSLTSGIAFAKIISEHEPTLKLNLKQRTLTALIGGPLLSGTMYCMGLLLTKIPSKDILN